MKSIREELSMIFNKKMRKTDEILDRMEQSVVKDAHKPIDNVFNKINQQSRPKASQDKDSETKSKFDLQGPQEKPNKEHEYDEKEEDMDNHYVNQNDINNIDQYNKQAKDT